MPNPIQHVVIIVKENHTFDNYFGRFPGANGFTMPQARSVFEAISGVVHEPSNFRRELEQSGLVRPTGMLARHGRGRPAALYRFRSSALEITDQFAVLRPPTIAR